jgi:hypothetical protein
MKIAILGWGSLVWDQRDLPIIGEWQPGGPMLRIEFSRISDDERLTLVIDERNGTSVPTRYAVSEKNNLELAILDLQKREGATDRDRIGFFDRQHNFTSERAKTKHRRACESIRTWAENEQFDAVIWTALGPRFYDSIRVAFSPPAAVRYVSELLAESRAKAFEYIRNAPPEIDTPVRRLFNRQHPL